MLNAPSAHSPLDSSIAWRTTRSWPPRVNRTVLAMEGLALTCASVDREQGLPSTIVLEMGGSSDLCALLKPGELVILWDPRALQQRRPDRTQFCRWLDTGRCSLSGREIENAADVVVWCCDKARGFAPSRLQDKRFVGNIVEAIVTYRRGELGAESILLNTVDRLVAIGSDAMMAAVARAPCGAGAVSQARAPVSAASTRPSSA